MPRGVPLTGEAQELGNGRRRSRRNLARPDVRDVQSVERLLERAELDRVLAATSQLFRSNRFARLRALPQMLPAFSAVAIDLAMSRGL
jgi:hypothetical protein